MKLRFTIAVVAILCSRPLLLFASGQLALRVVDRETGEPLAVRMHLKNALGKQIKPPGVPTLGDHFVFYDKIVLKLPNGGYEFQIERGLEYLDQTGHFTIENFADDTKTIELKRFVDMTKEGWYSGDLDVDRQAWELELAMKADDLHIAPVITWSNKKNPWAKPPPPKAPVNQFDVNFFDSLLGGELIVPGNTLRFFRLDQPLPLAEAATPKGSETALGSLPWMAVVEKARREQHAWVDAGAFFARDLPIWIAAGQIDSIQLANRHLEREGVVDNEAGGWPRDLALFPKPHGNGRWSQEIYYRLLECGLRIPPTAGSGSGVNSNPIGYNRVYVHLDPEMADDDQSSGETAAAHNQGIWDRWWEALRAGRVSVTNGPLIRPNVEGHLPGYVFKVEARQTLELPVALTLSTRDKIRYLEIVKNGRSTYEVNLEDFKAAGGKLPPVKFDESGWFLVRAVADNTKTYRYAATGPYFVEVGYQPRISRKSTQFFLDWTNKRSEEIDGALKKSDSAESQAIRHGVEQAQKYWTQLRERATSD